MLNNNTQDNPCLTCNDNCCNVSVEIYPEDEEHVPKEMYKNGFMLLNDKHQCVALTDNKCSIHDNKPIICRKYKCEKFFKGVSNGRIT